MGAGKGVKSKIRLQIGQMNEPDICVYTGEALRNLTATVIAPLMAKLSHKT